jgi:CelD/BcsL family acetyltransferase involved in cellulose biosynthesis
MRINNQAPGERTVQELRGGLQGYVLAPDQILQCEKDWQDLCARTAEDNVYYSPRYARALLDTVDAQRGVRFATVWDGSVLLAVLPFTIPRLALPIVRPSARAWQSKYTFSCMPLLDKTRVYEAAAALLELLAAARNGEWRIPVVNTQGEASGALTHALDQSGCPWSFAGEFQRASLEPQNSLEDHLGRNVSSKRRRDLARNRRRLEQLGTVGHATHGAGEGLARAVSTFLALEKKGWKGQRGTALACDELSTRFAVQAFTGDEATSICRADVLTLDGEAIAVSLVAFAGDTGFTVKCAFDEAYRTYSAGLLLELEVIRSLCAEKWARRLDAATAGAHVVDDLWSGRVVVADLIFSVAGRHPEVRFRLFRFFDALERRLREWAKQKFAAGMRAGFRPAVPANH